MSLVGAAGMMSGVAQAQTSPDCNDPTLFPNPVYLTGSSAFEPMLAKFSVAIQNANAGVTIIYLTSASCDGISAALNQPALTGTGHYYTPDPAATATGGALTKNCNFDNAALGVNLGIKPSIGVSDVPFNLCPGNDKAVLPATLGNWNGPIQSMLIVVPKGNATTTSISAEQAADIWGCGATGGISPYIDETAIQQRSSTSGTQILIGRAIGVSAGAFKGNPNSGTSQLIASLRAVPDPMKAIGFVAADAYQQAANAGLMNALAFRAFNQIKAYYADSTATAIDKRNVRDGHYAIQSPLNFFAPVTAGVPAPLVKKTLDFISGAAVIDPTKPNGYVDIVANAGDVPTCAMKVQISPDANGFFMPYKPAVSCGCYFESVVTQTSPVGCTPCTATTTCPAGTTCQTGFCE
jgi:ABC-type phosphate transport system substrate-binding protein